MSKFGLFKILAKGVFKMIVQESLICSLQHNHSDFNCGVEDFMAFVGILLFPGHCKFFRQKLYWDLDHIFGCVLIREATSKHLLISFCLNDNSKIPSGCTDCCYKIRPLIECLNQNFMQHGYLYTFNKQKNCWIFWTSSRQAI